MEGAEQQLCEAAKCGDIEKIKTLIDAEANVTFFDSEGLTPLMYATKHGHADVIKALLEVGAPWNTLSHSNLSAGDFAMEYGHQVAFEVLLNTVEAQNPQSGLEAFKHFIQSQAAASPAEL